ncbi:MAG: hypothetical protein ACW987_18665 [Candidatus Thorarchaeota archaeon]|jgi:hypothetical protein
MKIVKLSGSQTTTLANLIPYDKGAGSYTFCTYCYHQKFEQFGDKVEKICGNPVVDTGLATSQCFYMNKPQEGSDVTVEAVPEDDLDRSFLVTGDGANPTASADVQGTIEKSTFHPQDSEGD